MPIKPKVDWDVAKALYLQGLSAPEIAKKLGCKVGTLRANRKRQGWAISKAKLQEVASPCKVDNSKQEIEQISGRVKQKLAMDLEAQANLLERHPPCTLKELPGKYGRTSTTATLAGACARVFGWDQMTGKAVINIGVLNQLKLGETVGQSSEQVANQNDQESQVVDV